MYTIIGLGSAGCNIAELFETGGYKVKLIDVDIEGDNCFSFPVQNSVEEYEKHTPDLSAFFSDVTDKIILILAGSGKISGSTLKVLKQLKNKELNILYIRPDIELLSSYGKLQDRLTFNVLQEYARSGVFKSIMLISNTELETILGDVPILEYNSSLNKIIYNILESYIASQSKDAVIDNANPPKEISRIVTFGVYDIENNIEKIVYQFNNIDDKCYHFFINENELKTNNKLFRVIKERMREKIIDNTKISYKIYSTNYDKNYCYFVAYSKKIQE